MSDTWLNHGTITGPIVMIASARSGAARCRSSSGISPLIAAVSCVIDPDDSDRRLLDERGIRYIQAAVTRENYRDMLKPLLTAGGGQGFCVNLSVDTSSLDIMEFCRELRVLYIDTVVEPWVGFYWDTSAGPAARSNYMLRETVLAAKRKNPGGTTAVSCCGANPGMVSWFVKQALVNVASDLGLPFEEPTTREGWAKLMRDAGVKGVHIAERDTQRAKNPKPTNVFVNTWSVEGFLSEGMQPAELGWGTHEPWMPENGRKHETGCDARDLSASAGCEYPRPHLVPHQRRAIWLPRHPQ